jgi:DNA integrity scanning protein DisA with diadenylate cyclase activity
MKEHAMQTMERETDYVSRPKVLLRFFVKSRNSWKRKCRNAKAELKLAKNQNRAVQESRAHWKALSKQLRHELQETRRQLEEEKTGAARR